MPDYPDSGVEELGDEVGSVAGVGVETD